MVLSTCPIATVAASAEHVWSLLSDPVRYSEWWDLRTERVDPPGPIAPSQTIHGTSRALGRAWPVTTTIVGVDAASYALDLRTELPLGIAVRNHIRCQPLDATACRLSFG